jgi:D-beta-D-heptose 7-phosphate kinase/D-beta-D-heptose 1-phosphate adenosyltransferase
MPFSTEALVPKMAAWKPFRLLVVGDFMLDQALSGAAERLSPDAPVPVLLCRGREDLEETAGGASNVALCAAALGATVHCVGVTGGDAEAQSLRALLKAGGCASEHLVEDASRPTTVKRSLIGLAQHRHPQKMFRLDMESREPISPQIEARLLAAIDAALPACDIVCLEDYGKGVCTPALCAELIRRCRAAKKRVLVDPAAISDYGKYKGCTAVTPNRTEAEQVTGLRCDSGFDASTLRTISDRLLRQLEMEAVVLTLDRHGALLGLPGSEPVHVPTLARKVYDVTGAGDMVLAALAGALMNGFSWLEAVQLANVAAGLEVEVFGARPIPLAQIRTQVLLQAGHLAGKIRARADLAVELEARRAAGQRVVFTNGCFDVLHAGHVASLREARSLGDCLVVALNGDASVRQLKGHDRPVFPLAQRMEVMEALECVDFVTWFDEPTADATLLAARPHVYAKGGDYRAEQIPEMGVVKQIGAELSILGLRPGLSTTSAIHRIRGEHAGMARS